MVKTPKSSNKFICDICLFGCINKQDYTRHLSTAKHINLINPNYLPSANIELYICVCGKEYKHSSTLCNHKKKCLVSQGPNTDTFHTNLTNTIISTENESPEIDKRDQLIERLFTSNTDLVSSSNEMKTMIHLLLEKYQESQLQNQELMSKIIDVMPQMGNTTNTNSNNNNTTNNNTLNFYLTHTCKDAETIHDFTDRFVQRSVDFFKGNYVGVAHNEVDLVSNIYGIFKDCLDENPQTRKFVQTTDVKNGVVYIKEKPRDANWEVYGKAEFIKHMDGFEKAGSHIGHAINRAFFPIQANFEEIMERECGKEPNEDDYEDEDEYERDMDIYKGKTGDLKRHLLLQSLHAINLFDSKKIRNEVLENTRRLKDT